MTLQPETWTHELGRRVRTLLVLKIFANLSGIAAFFYAYFWIMRHPLSAATVIPVIWIDDLVPFSPQSFFLYASLWVYVGLGSLFTKDRRELAAWAAACFSMIIVGLGIFMALPTKVPDFAVDWSQYPSLAFLKGVDATGNALPSLHAAFAVFTAAAVPGQLTAVRAPRAVLAWRGLLCPGIGYSAMGTRPPLALDIIPRAGLAGRVWN